MAARLGAAGRAPSTTRSGASSIAARGEQGTFFILSYFLYIYIYIFIYRSGAASTAAMGEKGTFFSYDVFRLSKT